MSEGLGLSDDLVGRLRHSDGFKVFTASDGQPAIRADTDLMREAADQIEALTRIVADLVETSPFYTDREWGHFCLFCGAEHESGLDPPVAPVHRSDCLWVKANHHAPPERQTDDG